MRERGVRPHADYLATADEFFHWAADDANTGGSHPKDWSLVLPRVELALRVAEAHMHMAEILLTDRRLEDGQQGDAQKAGQTASR